MNARERLLASIVGGLLLVLGLGYVVTQVLDSFDQRHDDIARLNQEAERKRRTVRLGEAAQRQIKALAPRSLPQDTETARSQYVNWLLTIAQKSGLEDVNVAAIAGRNLKDVFFQHPFQLNARGTPSQYTAFLYEFYSVDLLHRIARMSVKPLASGDKLDLALAIEAVSLNGVPEKKTLELQPSERLQLESLKDYQQAFVQRNFFAPANKLPELPEIAPQTAHLERPFNLRIQGKDPDAGQTLSYSLTGENPPGVTVDPKSGALSWTPKEKGEFVVHVKVQDSSTPPGETSRDIKIAVTDPPPEAKPMVAEFDASKHAVVSAITEINGAREVWVSVRTDGRVLKLREGDKVEVGSFKGVVKKIDKTMAEIEVAGQTQRINLGSMLTPSEG